MIVVYTFLFTLMISNSRLLFDSYNMKTLLVDIWNMFLVMISIIYQKIEILIDVYVIRRTQYDFQHDPQHSARDQRRQVYQKTIIQT